MNFFYDNLFIIITLNVTFIYHYYCNILHQLYHPLLNFPWLFIKYQIINKNSVNFSDKLIHLDYQTFNFHKEIQSAILAAIPYMKVD